MAKNNFTLTLDTLAPEGSITRPAQYLKSLDGKKVSIVKGDAVLMKVWFDTTPAGDISKAPTSFEPAATEKAITLPSDGTYYAHLILRDEVANDSAIFSSEEIVYDVYAPVVTEFKMTDLDGSEVITNERTVNYSFNYSDDLSGVASCRIYGAAIEEQTFEVTGKGTKTGTIKILDSAADGDITVSVEVTDKAGNTSIPEAGKSIYTIKLDTKMDAPILSIKGLANGTWTNATEVTAVLVSGDSDIVAYKIWEGTEPGEWSSYEAGKTLNVEKAFAMSGEGDHTFNAMVKDTAGSISYAENTVTLKIDHSAPIVTAAVDRALISHVDGYNTVKLTYTENSSISGFKAVAFDINGIAYTGDIAEIASSNFVEGDNKITVKVTDNAGNVGSATKTVVLDSVAPANVELDGTLNTWYNIDKPFGIAVRATDEHAVATMYAWTDTSKTSTEVPANTTPITVTGNPQTIGAADINWNLVESATNYLHVKVVDEIGNASYLLAKNGEVYEPHVFGWDITPPTGSVRFEKSVYNGEAAYVTLSWADNVSGVVQMKLEGDIAAIDWENVPAESKKRSVTLNSGDGIKSVKVYYRDAAGNESAAIVGENTTELDMSKPSAGIALFKADGETKKPGVSAEAETVVKISYTDADGRGAMEYKLYGDFVGSSEEWVPFSADKGTDSKAITVTAIAPTGSEKVARNFHVVVRDNAGNESPVASASFYLDPTKPEAVVENLDHNRISTVHVFRNCIDSTHPTGDSYADEVKFYIAPSEHILEYKVCAYADFEAAKKGSAADPAIPMDAKSVHMSGNTNSDERIDCLIKGADYEKALGISGTHEGAHVVVVYVKNEAGLWSDGYAVEAN